MTDIGKATPRQLGALRRHNNSTGFRGVAYDKRKERFRAEIGNRKSGNIKRGPCRLTALEAAQDYDAMARTRYGKDAHLNFPGPGELSAIHIELDPGRCAYGHDLAYYGYVDPHSSEVNCRQCNAWAVKRYKQRSVLEPKP